MTRGFLLAGASPVISSQWKIRDNESMRQFMAWLYDAAAAVDVAVGGAA